MNRRTYLCSVVAGAGALGGTIAVADRREDPALAYRENARVVTEREDLRLRLRQDTVRLGDTVAFEVTNTGDSTVVLGCRNPWALQRRADGQWRHVAWTEDRYYQLCATELPPGESSVTAVELSETGLETQAGEVRGDLRPGRYQFLLVGTSPSLATEFRVLDAG
ncbi:immunoglobulin-like domain-containing protein [Halorussus lipolyticus]|uniref:immunoglobulin-like domain-containing protein n=1 Tax=Halorussus lipolyticus TaxID=3034024 RepID=UPI0023E8590F|nr:immunoglobulin-like domain-containing protein [Halorussus sp. DT80]